MRGLALLFTAVLLAAPPGAPPEAPASDLSRLDAAIEASGLSELGAELGVLVFMEGRGALYERDPDRLRAAASSIKTAVALDLLGQRKDFIDTAPGGLDMLLRPGMHPAFRGFTREELARARAVLPGMTHLELAQVMMGRTLESNDVYNAACNVLMVKLGGPEAIGARLAGLDPAFEGFELTRYMVTWNGDGDNRATPRALTALYRMISAGHVPGLDAERVAMLRELALEAGGGGANSIFGKAGTLYPEPLARAQAGYVERGEKGDLVFAIMGEVPDPGLRDPTEVFVTLLLAVNDLADLCRDPATFGVEP